VPVPWETTIINPAYRSVVNSWNIDLTVAAASVVEGSVNAEWANITANGTTSVPIGFVIQAVPGTPEWVMLPVACWSAVSVHGVDVPTSLRGAD
jgi:hypothetical protein